MDNRYIDSGDLPFCRGCSHNLIIRHTAAALEKIGIDPLDVIMVTDIGCHGIIDRKSHTHTVHGLHGRSVALAVGISAALNNPRKKVIVFIGDGGSTIGINHIIGAAHRNFDMTVIVHNNMLYGMTGGQRSDLTPGGFRTRSPIGGFTEEPLDLVKITGDAGAAYVSRIAARGDFSDSLVEAFRIKGFSLVEILEICPAYGIKQNRDIKIADIGPAFNLPLETHMNENANKIDVEPRAAVSSLLGSLSPVPFEFSHALDDQFTVLVSGSAGEGVQVAAEIFITAAVSSGLNATKKGSYPVTVGTGFSAAEVILSPRDIGYTGITKIDWVLVSSEDGTSYLSNRIKGMTEGSVLADSTITLPSTGASVLTGDFRGSVNPKESTLVMMLVLLEISGIFPVEALIKAISDNRIGEKTDTAALLEAAKTIREQISR
ncbi:MAG: 2-oxoacid:acceptor oxidoreductase family protein [Candidatus Krumholzibacteriota bacterium]|nr:2-oxoacid:acceptor oxidoreductase family protein [Candidatus Krumholzibacteriota bacterium]